MRLLYRILFDVGFALSWPFYFLKMWRRGNWREGFGQRFGRLDSKLKQACTNRAVLWLHAVSVGEVNVSLRLIRALETLLPNLKLVVSTTTSTGMAELRKKLPRHIEKIYFPIDRRSFVSRAMRALHPAAIVLVEAEIWPNFLWRAQDGGVPVFLVNARLSERSYRGYRRWRVLFGPIFASLAGVSVPQESDAERIRELGTPPERIRVAGNMKFDGAALPNRPVVSPRDLLRQIGVGEEALILLGGSTHRGEEALLADIFLRLKIKFPQLFLTLAPRHFERGKEVGKELAARQISFLYRSQLSARMKFPPGQIQCLLINTTGELRFFYEEASVIFIGKSLRAHGGQNPIEPAALGKAVLFGPHMENFAAIAAQFVNSRAAVQVKDDAQLEAELERLLASAPLREELGRRALGVVERSKGAAERTAEMIAAALRPIPRPY